MQASLVRFYATRNLFDDFGRVARHLRLKVVALSLALTEDNNLYRSVLILS